ncbi:FAD-dependent oxidoreductase [Candidatus Woesebacteria bacterium]|nr:FAD-dependent oxidoreductase [Candidatus Woesebacteria bacterium]
MKLTLVEKKEVAKDTKSFIFEPEKEVKWLPGQYFYFTLPKLTHNDPKGATRHFTIYLSPTEGKNIGFTTRIRDVSGFKQSADELKIGDVIEGEGPEGTFVLDENEVGEHVLLAGGIGITPFRSIIKYNIDRGLKDIKLHLLYANSTPEEIAFRKELESWAKANENIKVDMTVSQPDKGWQGLTGRIDEPMIKSLATNYNLQTTTFWLCGPPPMVEATEKILGGMGISSGRVRSEKFTGY